MASDSINDAVATGAVGQLRLRGFVLLAIGQILARGLTFAALAYVARTLDVEMFGLIGFAAVVATYFLLLVDGGLDLIATRAVARRESSIDGIVGTVLFLRLKLAVVAMAVLGLLAPWITSSSNGLMIMVAYSLTFVSYATNLKWSFQALEQNAVVAIALVLSQAMYLGGILLWVHGPQDALRVPILLFVSELIGTTFLILQYRKQGLRIERSHSLAESWNLLKEGFPLAGVQAVRTVGINFDLLILGVVDSPWAVGLYSVITRIMMLLREFGALYYIPLFPQLSRAAKETSDRFMSLGQAGIRQAATLMFPVVVGGCLIGRELLSFVFGPEYASASAALSLLLIAFAFGMLAGVYRFGLVAYNQQKLLFQIIAAGTILNIIMNVVLVPRYSLIGAACSAVASEALVFLLSWLGIGRSVRLSPWKPVSRPALATGAMVLLLFWLQDTVSLPMRIGIGIFSYFAFAVLFGAVQLHEFIGRGTPPRVRRLVTPPSRNSNDEVSRVS